MKKLGFGLMRLPLNPSGKASDIDMNQLNQMVDLFLEKGFTYFDTAWMYNGFASERAVKEALISRYPRDSFTLTTKLHSAFVNAPEDRDKIFFSQMEKTGADFFDYYLLHGIEAGSYDKFERFGCFEWLLDKKEKGLVRHAGFSFHGDAALLDRILTKHPEMELVQLQINYLDWESPWIRSKEVYETALRHGKDIVVMEPVKGGTLARVPDEALSLMNSAQPGASPASWAIRFAAGLKGVRVVLSGMSSLQQMRDNVSYMAAFQPLTDEQVALTRRFAEIINARIAVPCTGCSYCTEGCPQHIAIPQYFSLYNEDMREDLREKGWTINYTNYALLTKDHGRAGDCVGCGQCEGVCPQHLPIIEHLKAVSKHFD